MAEAQESRRELARQLLGRAHSVESAMARALRGTGIGVPHFLVLDHLAHSDGAATSDLLAVAHVPAATLTRTLDKLVDLALVHRTLDGLDRRRILVRISDRGRARLAEWSAPVDAAVASVLPSLREWEAAALADLLDAEGAEIIPTS